MKLPKFTNWFINKDDMATCYTLFRWFGGLRVELVHIPAGHAVTPHSHKCMDKELIFLAGDAKFHRTAPNEARVFNANHDTAFLRKFTVKHYHKHWADEIKKDLWFILIERWSGEVKSEVTSMEVA